MWSGWGSRGRGERSFQLRNFESRDVRRWRRADRVWHSQIVSTDQPARRSSDRTFRSRNRFRSNLVIQYFRFDEGIERPPSHECRCQKHPCTKMTFLLLANTRSGLPGSPAWWRRKRNPSPCTIRRTVSSGDVSVARTDAIVRLRSSGVRLSIN